MIEEDKKKMLRRLKIAEGQVRGLQKMIEEEKYCISIINQSLAVKKALSSFEDAMLEHHLKTHVAHQMTHGERGKAEREIMAVYKLSKKK